VGVAGWKMACGSKTRDWAIKKDGNSLNHFQYKNSFSTIKKACTGKMQAAHK
jgi:hypothetical protein